MSMYDGGFYQEAPAAGGGGADSTEWGALDGVNFVTESDIGALVVGSNALDNGAIYASATTFEIDSTGLHGTGFGTGLNLAHADFGTLEDDITTYGEAAVVVQAAEIADLWILWGDGGRNTPWYTAHSMNGIEYEGGVFPGSHRAAGIRTGGLTGYINNTAKTEAPTAICIHFNGTGRFGGRITWSAKPFNYDLTPSDMEHSLGTIVAEGLEDWNGQENAMGQLFTKSATKHDRVLLWYRKGNVENAIIKSVRWFGRTLANV